jgi:hypothetical protein
MVAGVVAVVFFALSLAAGSFLASVFGVVVGIVLIIVGLVLLVTEIMETWLTQGQSALVDGLQAG